MERNNSISSKKHTDQGVVVRVCRPSDSNPLLAAAVGPCQPSPNLNLSSVVLSVGTIGGAEGLDRIFVGGLSYYSTEAQMRDLLQAFGPIWNFDLIRDKDTENSKGYGFCIYQNPAVTDTACASLNGLKRGDKTLIVRCATVSGHSKPEEDNIYARAQQHIAMQKIVLEVFNKREVWSFMTCSYVSVKSNLKPLREKAISVYHEMKNEDISNWNSFINSCVQHVILLKVFNYLNLTRLLLLLHLITLVCFILVCVYTLVLQNRKAIHENAVRPLVGTNDLLETTTVETYRKSEHVSWACEFFVQFMTKPNDCLPWNELIRRYGRNGVHESTFKTKCLHPSMLIKKSGLGEPHIPLVIAHYENFRKNPHHAMSSIL